MRIFRAGFFGLIGIACVWAFKIFFLGPIGHTQKASEYMLETDIGELKQTVIQIIADKKSLTDELAQLTYKVDVPTVIAKKCRTVKPSQVDNCEYRLRDIFSVITIEDAYPGWRGICEDFHKEALETYGCIVNFSRNSGWAHSKLIPLKENERIEECFRNVPKIEFDRCIK